MSTFTQILYQIVFSTKNRGRTLTSDKRSSLFEYIAGIHRKKGCHLYRINGIEDHIHIATHIHPTVALATLVKDIKLATSSFIKDESLFKSFAGWLRSIYVLFQREGRLSSISKTRKNIIGNSPSRKS